MTPTDLTIDGSDLHQLRRAENPHPAPHNQVHYPFFVGTSGADFLPMAFNDAIATPPELATPYFTEKMIYVPHTYYVNSHSHAWGGVPPKHSAAITSGGEGGLLASALDAAAGEGWGATRGDSISSNDRVLREFEGLPSVGPILANFNQFYKIDGPTWATWMRVLRKAPDASLWLRSEVVDASSHTPPQTRPLTSSTRPLFQYLFFPPTASSYS